MIDKIKANCKLVKDVIEERISVDDPVGCMEKLDRIINIGGLAAENRANAKVNLRECVLTVTEGIMGTEYQKEMPASTLNNYIKAKCAKAEGAYDLAESMEKKLSYANDGMRTIISMLKAEFERS